MSKQSYKDIQSDAPARHISIHAPRGERRDTYRDAETTLTDRERQQLYEISRIQGMKYSDFTYLLSALDEMLESQFERESDQSFQE